MAAATPARFLVTNLGDTATVAATDAATGFPAANVQLVYRQEPWRSANVSGTKSLTFDHGSAKAITAAIILDHNLTTGATVTLRGSTDNFVGSDVALGSFTVTRSDDGNTIAIDPLVIYVATASYQYHRLAIADGSNPDGFIQVGRVFLGNYSEAVRNFLTGWTVTPIDMSEPMRSSNGVRHTLVRPTYRIVETSYARETDTARARIRRVADAVGIHTPLFVDLLPGNDAHDQYTLYCHFRAQPKWTQRNGLLWDFPVALEEDL